MTPWPRNSASPRGRRRSVCAASRSGPHRSPRPRREGTATGAPPPSAVRTATRGTLHGREELLRTVVATTHAPVVLLSGEAGIGKSRLAAQAAARLAGVGGRSVTGLAFRHPLLRLTCYELLSRLRALSLHAAWSETLLRHRPDDVDALAWHLLRAEDRRAADHLRRAAERAAALYANEEAGGYYRRPTPLVAADPVLAAGVGTDHGVLIHRMSRYGDAVGVLRTALASADRAGDADTAVAVTARLAEALIRTGRQDKARRALDARSPGPATLPGAVAAHRLASSIIDFVEGRHAEAVESAAADLPGRAGAGPSPARWPSRPSRSG
ncbi:hypothetical protein [Streptomyces sp. NPDC093089]|uniref:hypothetical protein n=1 Tax=Streptomyces sp. NPDC093089 TaxID=3366024 RepID=UPI0038036D4E